MRSTYSAPRRFYADDAVRTNRINWYWVPEDSIIYEEWHSFTPGIEHADIIDDSFPEVTAIRTRLRQKTSGGNRWGTLGLHVDGEPDDFLMRSPKSKFWIAGNPPADPCGNVTAEWHGLRFRHIDSGDEVYSTHDLAGLRLGSLDVLVYPPPVVDLHGLKLGSIDVPKPPPSVESYTFYNSGATFDWEHFFGGVVLPTGICVVCIVTTDGAGGFSGLHLDGVPMDQRAASFHAGLGCHARIYALPYTATGLPAVFHLQTINPATFGAIVLGIIDASVIFGDPVADGQGDASAPTVASGVAIMQPLSITVAYSVQSAPVYSTDHFDPPYFTPGDYPDITHFVSDKAGWTNFPMFTLPSATFSSTIPDHWMCMLATFH